MKNILGTVITLAIGGTVYTFSQADVVKNFSEDTGLTQQEAEQYVSEIDEEDLATFGEIGLEFISDGQDIVAGANDIDCVNYEYEWESYTGSCEEGKSQLKKLGNSEIALGKAYTVLDTEEATEEDISLAISYIDMHNANLELSIVTAVLVPADIDEIKNTNSYNKALLQAALDSD